MPKKSSSSDSLIDLIIVLVGIVILIAIIGVYFGGGFYYNGQINKSFAENNCADVVRYGNFVSLYPQRLFGGLFDGHAQYTQCRAVLDVEQAIEAKNWPFAALRAKEYLSAYPTGPFAVNVHAQLIVILSEWSKELIASNSYASSIDTLKQLIEADPTGPTAQPAIDDILNVYLLWTKKLVEEENYKEAERTLNGAYDYFAETSQHSEQIKQELINLHITWGNVLVQTGDTENGFKQYQLAEELAPGTTDVDLLIARANLEKAVALAKKGSFGRALEKVKEVAESAKTEQIKTEANDTQIKILIDFSASDSMEAKDQIKAALPVICDGQRPELPIFGLDAGKIRFGLHTPFTVELPLEWAAQTPGELHYIACVTEKPVKVQTCPYEGGFFVKRMRYDWNITLIDVTTGEKYKSTLLKGGTPPACKSFEYFQQGTDREYAGGRPTAEQVIEWLRKLNLLQ